MELMLTRRGATEMVVHCDGQLSHTRDIRGLELDGVDIPPADPVTYGKLVYDALFPKGTPAHKALMQQPERVLLVVSDETGEGTDDTLDMIPWEYASGPTGFLVCDVRFVRGVPTSRRIAPRALNGNMHIVAVPTNPLDEGIVPLNVEVEWHNLANIVGDIPYAIVLERTRPPTIEQVRSLITGNHEEQVHIVHFMGHGEQNEQGAHLCFEQENGSLERVTAREFVRRVSKNVFLVTLNACESAAPGVTPLSNLAAALVRQGVPYALGMRFSIYDDDALVLSRIFYDELSSGVSVEEALYQARLTLVKRENKRDRRFVSDVIGIPVLYTALTEPAPGLHLEHGTPTIVDRQPPLELYALPRAEGTFRGRVAEMQQIGKWLTGDVRKRIVTIHGIGGQGKTALAREVCERFAFAWRGGVYAASLEGLPTRSLFVANLARALNVSTETLDTQVIEQQLLTRLNQQQTLLVLDNAETLQHALHANNPDAYTLVEFLKLLPGPKVSLLITSRHHLGWLGEAALELEGLSPREGGELFRQSAPQRVNALNTYEAILRCRNLSEKVEGHPLALTLLGKTFNETAQPLDIFINDYEQRLLDAHDKYKSEDNRHRTLYTCIDTSVRYLDEAHRELLSKLWIFHAPFQPEAAIAIFDTRDEQVEEDEQGKQDDGEEESSNEGSNIPEYLYTLWRYGLLERETPPGEELALYTVLPTMRLYIERYIRDVQGNEEVNDALLVRFGEAYSNFVRFLYTELDRRGDASLLAQVCHEDIERGIAQTEGSIRGWYLCRWGWILQRLGDRRNGLDVLEHALQVAQSEQDEELIPHVLNNMAILCKNTGKLAQALQLYEQVLVIDRAVGNKAGEAATLNNIAAVYADTGKPAEALQMYEQALPLTREVRDKAGEAATLNNMAAVYANMGKPAEALRVYEQALPLRREVGDKAGEAATLNNMAAVYENTGKPAEALQMYEQALSILQEVGDRATEAATLNNIALVYARTSQPEKALQMYEQALVLTREVGDKAGEAATLNNIAYHYRSLERYEEAEYMFAESIQLSQQVSNPAGEVAGLIGLAFLLYQSLSRPQHTIKLLERAMLIFQQTGLPQDAAGQTPVQVQQWLQAMRQGISLDGQTTSVATLPDETLETIVGNTIAVMTDVPEKRDEWRQAVVQDMQHAQQQGQDWQIEVEMFNAILAMLDGQPVHLPDDHPYAGVIAAIQEGITTYNDKHKNEEA